MEGRRRKQQVGASKVHGGAVLRKRALKLDASPFAATGRRHTASRSLDMPCSFSSAQRCGLVLSIWDMRSLWV